MNEKDANAERFFNRIIRENYRQFKAIDECLPFVEDQQNSRCVTINQQKRQEHYEKCVQEYRKQLMDLYTTHQKQLQEIRSDLIQCYNSEDEQCDQKARLALELANKSLYNQLMDLADY